MGASKEEAAAFGALFFIGITVSRFLAGFIVIGLGCAPVYPRIIHSTPDNFGAENSQGIIGIQMASAYVGSTFIPPVFGVIANHVSLRWLPVYLLMFFVLLVVMIERTEKVCRGDCYGA